MFKFNGYRLQANTNFELDWKCCLIKQLTEVSIQHAKIVYWTNINTKNFRTAKNRILTWVRYCLIISSLSSAPLFSSFCSILLMILHDARRAPITFLYATLSKFLSSTVSSTSKEATFFIASTISETKHFSFRKYYRNVSYLMNLIRTIISDFSVKRIFFHIYLIVKCHFGQPFLHKKRYRISFNTFITYIDNNFI